MAEIDAALSQGLRSLPGGDSLMLLKASGWTRALHGLLKDEVERGPDFIRLANSLAMLYPDGSEEKRLVQAMLLAVPR